MKGLVIIGLCVGLFACTNRKSVPSGIIVPDSMRVILKDVIMADQYASQFILKDSVKKDSTHRNVKIETLQLYETIFKLHGISREDFRKSMSFYYSRPDLFKTMLDSLSMYETRHRADLYKPRPPVAPAGKDSVKTALPGLQPEDSAKLRLRDSIRLHQDGAKEPHVKTAVK
jgi:hypothetical protein